MEILNGKKEFVAFLVKASNQKKCQIHHNGNTRPVAWSTRTLFTLMGVWSNVYHVGCEFLGRGSILSVCQITDGDLGQVG